MKFLKTFEKIINPESDISVNKFFDNFDRYKKLYPGFDAKTKEIENNYSIPEMFHEYFMILYFLYHEKWFWVQNIKREDNYIKRKVKKHVLNLILEKFKQEPQSYFLLKKCLNRRPNFNNPRSFRNIRNSTVKYIFFLFNESIKNTTNWIKDTEIYNL